MSVSMSGGNQSALGREVEGRRDERDRVRDREGRDDEHERAKPAERDHEAEKEQQVVGAVENVEEAELRRIATPPGASADRAARAPGSPLELECAFDAARAAEPQRRHDAHAEARRARDRIENADRSELIGYSKQHVEQRLVPHERRVGRQRRPGDVRERRVERRTIDPTAARRVATSRGDPERRVPLVDRDVLSAIQSVAASRSGGVGARRSRDGPWSRVRNVDVTHRGERHADQQTQPLALGPEEGLDGHVVGISCARNRGSSAGRSAAQASATQTTRRITGARPRGSVRQSFTDCAQCILAPD